MRVQDLFEAAGDQHGWLSAVARDVAGNTDRVTGEYDGFKITAIFKDGKIETLMLNGRGQADLSFKSKAELKAYLDKEVAERRMTPAQRAAETEKAYAKLRKDRAEKKATNLAAGKPSNKFDDVDEGEKPDAKIIAFFNKMARTAERELLKRVLDGDPDNFGLDSDTTKAAIKRHATIYTQRITAHENGFEVQMNMDLDDIGGDSTNYEELNFDLSGKLSNDLKLGKPIATFSEQNDWERED